MDFQGSLIVLVTVQAQWYSQNTLKLSPGGVGPGVGDGSGPVFARVKVAQSDYWLMYVVIIKYAPGLMKSTRNSYTQTEALLK